MLADFGATVLAAGLLGMGTPFGHRADVRGFEGVSGEKARVGRADVGNWDQSALLAPSSIAEAPFVAERTFPVPRVSIADRLKQLLVGCFKLQWLLPVAVCSMLC